MNFHPRALGSILLVGTLALGGGAATAEEDTADGGRINVVDLPIEVLEEVLPETAEEAGLDYAPRLVSVLANTTEQRNRLASSGLDVTEHGGHDHLELVLYSQEEQDFLDDEGYRYEVVIPDMITRERERILADARFAQATAVSPLPSGRDSYRVLPDFLDEIDQLVADNQLIARKLVIGQSIEGRDIVGIEIAKDVAAEDGRPVFLQFGNHHAREWPSATIPMEFAHDLVEGLATGDERTVDLLTRARAIIVPVSNPDGYDASRTQGDFDLREVDGGDIVSIFATPGNAYKRKNCRIVDGETQPPGPCAAISSPGGHGVGIDLNRNYGALWGGPGAVGTEPDPDESVNGGGPLSPIYNGPAPFSEPETQSIRTLISTRQVTTLISHHTFSNLLLRPVGLQPSTIHPDGFPVGFAPDECFTTASGDDLGMQTLGEKLTAQTGYSNQFGWELYDTTGTTEDYSYNATGGYGYTFEIGPDEFHPPFEQVIAEYTGETESAESVTPGNAGDLTTSTGQECPGEAVEHDTVGGGLREALYLALENAADTATHSLITGEAPQGAEIAVSRTGEFPLWDGTGVEDTVTTSMTVAGEGDVTAAASGDTTPFTFHVNPSTRPFADSREYRTDEQVDEARRTAETIENSEVVPPGGALTGEGIDIPIEIGSGVQWLDIQSNLVVPTDDNDITLYAPDATPIADSANLPGEDESVEFDRAPGELLPGTYMLRIVNYAGTGQHETTITFGDYPTGDLPALEQTPRTAEEWTLTCSFDGEELDSQQVTVDRGKSVDVGEVCVAAAGAGGPQPAPDPDLAATGGGAAALAALALGGAVALATRRRED